MLKEVAFVTVVRALRGTTMHNIYFSSMLFFTVTLSDHRTPKKVDLNDSSASSRFERRKRLNLDLGPVSPNQGGRRVSVSPLEAHINDCKQRCEHCTYWQVYMRVCRICCHEPSETILLKRGDCMSDLPSLLIGLKTIDDA